MLDVVTLVTPLYFRSHESFRGEAHEPERRVAAVYGVGSSVNGVRAHRGLTGEIAPGGVWCGMSVHESAKKV